MFVHQESERSHKALLKNKTDEVIALLAQPIRVENAKLREELHASHQTENVFRASILHEFGQHRIDRDMLRWRLFRNALLHAWGVGECVDAVGRWRGKQMAGHHAVSYSRHQSLIMHLKAQQVLRAIRHARSFVPRDKAASVVRLWRLGRLADAVELPQYRYAVVAQRMVALTCLYKVIMY